MQVDLKVQKPLCSQPRCFRTALVARNFFLDVRCKETVVYVCKSRHYKISEYIREAINIEECYQTSQITRHHLGTHAGGSRTLDLIFKFYIQQLVRQLHLHLCAASSIKKTLQVHGYKITVWLFWNKKNKPERGSRRCKKRQARSTKLTCVCCGVGGFGW
jgi:hypothetical protein